MKKIVYSGLITVTICILLLFVTALIPQSAIQKNMEKSAEYYNTHQLFDHVTKNAFLSRQDNYADCILTNIIYHIDSNDLLHSVISANYYNPDGEGVNESFSYAVASRVEPNVDYSRYWHGSMVILRPLFTVFDITMIRIVLGVLVLCLTIWFEVLLFKKGYGTYGICYAIALISMSAWMCAFCVEYVMVFLIMSIELPVLFITMTKTVNCNVQILSVLFCSGIITAFLDFLTAETLTFTMAYCLYIVVKNHEHKLMEIKKEFTYFIKSFVVWGIGYSGMILLKWLIALLTIGKGSFDYTIQMFLLRLCGDATEGNMQGAPVVSNWERISGALWRNFGCIFPFTDTMSMKISIGYMLLVAFLLFSIWYVFRTKENRNLEICLLWVAIVPYFRFLIINNHSYIHFFFSYRAQIVTATVCIYVCLRNVITYFKLGKKRI